MKFWEEINLRKVPVFSYPDQTGFTLPEIRRAPAKQQDTQTVNRAVGSFVFNTQYFKNLLSEKTSRHKIQYKWMSRNGAHLISSEGKQEEVTVQMRAAGFSILTPLEAGMTLNGVQMTIGRMEDA